MNYNLRNLASLFVSFNLINIVIPSDECVAGPYILRTVGCRNDPFWTND